MENRIEKKCYRNTPSWVHPALQISSTVLQHTIHYAQGDTLS